MAVGSMPPSTSVHGQYALNGTPRPNLAWGLPAGSGAYLSGAGVRSVVKSSPVVQARIGDRAAQIWDLDPEQWADAACDVAGRNLSRHEWAATIGDLAPYRIICPDLLVLD
jgi:hypothetical protein